MERGALAHIKENPLPFHVVHSEQLRFHGMNRALGTKRIHCEILLQLSQVRGCFRNILKILIWDREREAFLDTGSVEINRGIITQDQIA